MKRRDFIKTAVGASLLIPNILLSCQKQTDLQTVSANADAMDEALQMMSDIAPLGNHAPMAVDEGFTNRQTFETDTDLTSIRSDARFQQVLARLPK